jgi:hypothetical protein
VVQLKNLFVFLLLVSVASCSFFKKKAKPDADVIARANEEYLYASDIQSITKGLKGQDSLDVLKSYAESWVRKKLLLQKAIENIPEDDLGITKKVEDYREALLLYEYEKALINQKLDTAIRPKELNDWYEKLKGDFPLENDVYQLCFIKLKKDAPDLDQARKWITKPKDEEDARKMEGYCKAYASSYTIDNGMWYEQPNVLSNFPLSQADVNALVSSGSYKEFKANDDTWFIKITGVMKKDEPSPLEFIREQIVRAIIEKRRLLLVEKVYNKIYQDGLQSKAFEVLVK